MLQVIGIILLIGVAIVALKITIAVMILAGLIFRTKETISLLIVGGVLVLIQNHSTASMVFVGVVLVIAFFRYAAKEAAKEAEDHPALPDKADT